MENINAEQVKKALECWANNEPCKGKGCPYFENDQGFCGKPLRIDALALINSLDQRIKELTEERDAMRGAVNSYIMHSKTLKGENDNLKDLVDKCFDTENALNEKVKKLSEENERLSLEYAGFEAGAKQLIERLKTQKYMVWCDGTVEIIPTVEQVRADTVRKMQERLHVQFHDRAAYTRSYVHDTIDQIAKEMLEDAE